MAVGRHRRGAPTHVLAILDQGVEHHPLVLALERAGVGVTALQLPGRAYLRERREVAEWCRRIRPAVVHTHGARVDVLDAGIVRRLGFPTVTTVHGFTGGGWKNRLYEHLQRRAFRGMSSVVAVSRAQQRLLEVEGVRRDRITVIPNAWDGQTPSLERRAARASLGVTDGRFLVGWVGRVGLEKGIDILLDSVPSFPGDASVVVLGDGRWRTAGERRAKTMGIEQRVSWQGVVPDAGSLFPAFDCFVLSSRTEGVPIVLFEAMAARVPIVATAVGGVPDVISETEALLVPAENPAALAAAVASVRRDSGAASRRAEAARRRLERDFSLAAWLDRYEKVYRAVTGEERANP